MLETLMLLGQVLSALLLLYGGYLVIARNPALEARDSEVPDRFLLLGHLHLDA